MYAGPVLLLLALLLFVVMAHRLTKDDDSCDVCFDMESNDE